MLQKNDDIHNDRKGNETEPSVFRSSDKWRSSGIICAFFIVVSKRNGESYLAIVQPDRPATFISNSIPKIREIVLFVPLSFSITIYTNDTLSDPTFLLQLDGWELFGEGPPDQDNYGRKCKLEERTRICLETKRYSGVGKQVSMHLIILKHVKSYDEYSMLKMFIFFRTVFKIFYFHRSN